MILGGIAQPFFFAGAPKTFIFKLLSGRCVLFGKTLLQVLSPPNDRCER